MYAFPQEINSELATEARSYFLIRLPVHQRFRQCGLPEQQLAEQASHQVTRQVTHQVVDQVRDQVGTKQRLSEEQWSLMNACASEVPVSELMAITGRPNRSKFRAAVLATKEHHK